MIHSGWYRHLFNGLIITAFVISIGFINITSIQEIIERVEGILYDTRLFITLPAQPRSFNEKIVIIDIDEKSIAEQGRYPWSRSKVSTLVENLKRAGVVVIAFDIIFSELENNPVDIIVKSNQQLTPHLVTVLNSLKNSVDADKQLAHALSETEVVLGMMFDHRQDNDKSSTQHFYSKSNTAININQKIVPSHIKMRIPSGENFIDIPEYLSVLSNINSLQENASGAGFINSTPESDGFIRKASLVINHQGRLYPSLALEAARVYTLSDNINTESRLSDGQYWFQGVSVGGHKIPTNEKGQILIPFKGASKSFDYISATDVLEQRVSQDKLEGAVAFVGTSAIGLSDLRATSVGIQYPGVEVHANVFEGLIHPEIIPLELDITLAIAFILLLITGVTLALLMTKQGPMRIFYICIGALVIHLVVNWSLWLYWKISLPQFQLLLLVTWLTLYYGSVGFINESYRRKNIKNIFNQYVPPVYIDKLLASKSGAPVKPERRVMSMLFADIRSFTQISENFSPEQLSEFMSEYLTSTTATIFDNLGTIDKYVGDMVMAFWNAPLDDQQHAMHAVETALAMVKSTQAMADTFKQRGWPAVNIGVGVSTGEMIVGDMGSTYRKAYTVLGDEVNLGARIESLTKYYGVNILISENTHQEVLSQGMLCRQIDTIRVKGKQKPVTIYEPIGLLSQQSSDTILAISLHQKAMKAYISQEWELAFTIFTQLKASSKISTKLYDIYIERVKELQNQPLNKSWLGIFTHQTK